MRAMILAAGLGTRLRPLTLTTPKALVKVGGRPMLEYSLDWLEGQGIREVLVNVHHFSEQISEFLQREGSRWRITFKIQDESRQLLGSGGGIALARDWLFAQDSAALFWNPDGLVFPNIPELQAKHAEHVKKGRLATINLMRHPDVGTKFHPVFCAGDQVVGFGRNSVSASGEAYHYAGPYILEREAAMRLPAAGTVSDVAQDLWFPLVKEQRFGAYFYEGPYQDLGLFSDIALAEARISKGDFSAYGIF